MRFTRNGFLTSVLVVAALFVGSFISGLFPDPQGVHDEPFLRDAPLGTPVELRTGTVTVTRLATAPKVTSHGSTATTTGTWLVADLTWTARDKPSLLSPGNLVWESPDGRRFGLQTAVTTGCGAGQPGITATCQAAFEVDRDALVGGHLLVPSAGAVDAPDLVARIDGGIDEARAAELLASTQTITLALPTERGR